MNKIRISELRKLIREEIINTLVESTLQAEDVETEITKKKE